MSRIPKTPLPDMRTILILYLITAEAPEDLLYYVSDDMGFHHQLTEWFGLLECY